MAAWARLPGDALIATRSHGPMACSTRARPGSPRSPTAPSNTIAIGEDAGRDPRYLSPYTEAYYDGVTPMAAYCLGQPAIPGRAGGYPAYRRFWRWAEPDRGLRRLRRSEQQVPARPRSRSPGPKRARSSPRAPTPATTTSCLVPPRRGQRPDWRRQRPLPQGFGQPRHIAGLVTLAGGEVISSDQY